MKSYILFIVLLLSTLTILNAVKLKVSNTMVTTVDSTIENQNQVQTETENSINLEIQK